MASLIPGYEYDIFISYRQKDNKGERWVSEFVEALKAELESTFKEEISVYFDINPHDGLLDTHDVGASLKEKLKCLVFIPVISHTYCDPKSFAWEHEFKAFSEQGSQDQFGLLVKLSNGNVANRVLPVRIYDLDIDDIKQCESVLGGVLRGIDFIYKEPGVNRPLKPDDDEKINLNRSRYRNQINKVANAAKEIITALRNPDQQPGELAKKTITHTSATFKNKRIRRIFTSLIALVLIITSLLLIPIVIKSDGEPEKTIAVLPFDNWNSDPEYSHLGDEIAGEIITQLQNINDFKRVLSRSSTMQFRQNRPSIPEIGKKLGVNYVIEGSIQRQKDSVAFRVQMIRAKKEDLVWGHQYKGSWEDIFSIQEDIAKNVARELKIALTPVEIKQIEKKPTENPKAYNLFLMGRFDYYKHTKESIRESIDLFNRAIELDSTLAPAYVGLAQAYQFLVRYSWMPREEGVYKAKSAISKAIELDGSNGEAHAALGLIMIVFDFNIYGPEKEFREAIRLSPNSAEVYSSYAQYLRWLGNYEEGFKVASRAAELDPLTPLSGIWLAAFYQAEGRYEECNAYLNKMLARDSGFIYSYAYLAFNYTLSGDSSRGLFYAKKLESFIGNNLAYSYMLGYIYAKTGEQDKAKKILNLFEEQSNNTSVDPVYIAIIYAGFGDTENTFKYLNKAYEIRSGQIIYLKFYSKSYFKDIQADPRYNELLGKIGFKIN
jgi:TolB-like protein/Tfp pilus assembly protein PilF